MSVCVHGFEGIESALGHVQCLVLYGREIPDELLRSANGAQVELNIEDKRNEEYVWRPPKIVAFSGAGHKLGRYCSLYVHSLCPLSK